MTRPLLAIAASLALALPAAAQDEPAPSPGEIVSTAAPEEWIAIPTEDMLVMKLAPGADGSERVVVIQLMPAPFSQGWVENIRTLARAEWYDGISVNRVQDNYVVQWGDPGHDNPESGEVETKPLPEGLRVMGEEDYIADYEVIYRMPRSRPTEIEMNPPYVKLEGTDAYGERAFATGWPVAIIEGRKMRGNRLVNPQRGQLVPIHCYGMVGVGRSYSPDTGSGAELYTVIGHAPRHLDRNIALVGRIISGMEHLSSLPRGSGALGFYTEEEADKRTPILSVRVASDLSETDRQQFEYLSTEGETFARYAEARANRRDPFFIHPAGGADICNIPVPIRPVAEAE